jgi:hypothetical protein
MVLFRKRKVLIGYQKYKERGGIYSKQLKQGNVE